MSAAVRLRRGVAAALGAAWLAVAPPPLRAQQAARPSAAAAPDTAHGAHHKKKKDAKRGADAAATGDSAGAHKTHAPRPLFATDAPLAITLTADFGAVFKDRDTLRVRKHPGTLTYVDERGAPAKMDVVLSTRGHFRLKPTTCSFAPLRVGFAKGQAKGTPFAGQHALKLVTHCRSGDRTYEQYVLREYVVYKVLNALTDRSFRNRLARVTYADAAHPDRPVTSYGYFVESEDELADRLDGHVMQQKGGRFEDFSPEQTDLVSVFEYMIGNTDWSLAALHNIRIIGSSQGEFLPVPYDFDWSGIVHTHYAIPDPRLPITTVRERYYRGPCRNAKQLEPTFAIFRARRDSILALYRGMRDLDPGYVKETEAYLAEFYETIGNATLWKHASERGCAESN